MAACSTFTKNLSVYGTHSREQTTNFLHMQSQLEVNYLFAHTRANLIFLLFAAFVQCACGFLLMPWKLCRDEVRDECERTSLVKNMK